MRPAPVEQRHTANVRETPERRIVSYFDHEFLPLSSARADQDITAIIEKGFTDVVLCVTETDVVRADRQTYLRDVVSGMKARGLTVWADPWGVGSVHGGEANSPFKESGELSCLCNDKLDVLVKNWLDTVVALDIQTVFWDEPEMKCDDHRQDEVRYIEKYTAEAAKRGLESAVCLCANAKKRHQLSEVAALDTVAEIATDPYFPNAFTPKLITRENRQQYVRDWAEHTVAVAREWNKRSHVWVQLFDIPLDQENLVAEHLAACRQAIADVAVWGFNGCASVPNFAKPGHVAPMTGWQSLELQQNASGIVA